MRFKEKILKLKGVSITKFIYYNFFSSNIERKKGKYLIPYRYSVIDLAPSSKVVLREHLFINYNKMRGSKAEAYLKLKEGAKLIVDGVSQLCYSSTIEIHKNAEMRLGGVFINCGTVIIAAKSINIGTGVFIAREVMIYDSDHHKVISEMGKKSITSKNIEIGNHVWIGLKAMIMKGVKIEDGAVIGAYSVVLSKVSQGLFVMGAPARAFMKVHWEE